MPKQKNKMMDKDIHNLENTQKEAKTETTVSKKLIILKDKIHNKHKTITFMFQVRQC